MPKHRTAKALPTTLKTDADEPAYALVTDSPLGELTLVQRGETLTEIRFGATLLTQETPRSTPLLRQAESELSEYFSGKRTVFEVSYTLLGTPFQRRVWQTLSQTVPYGATVSYGELAMRCDCPGGSRAVGMANHRNPLPILIPCHRVIGANGKMVGYGGGLPKKEWLLALEKATRKG